MPSPRRTRVTDGGSPARSSSARSMDLGEMSQMSLIPAALNIPRQRRQQQPAVAEDPGSDSESDDNNNNNKENEGFQPAPRTTSGRPPSDRHPLELIPPNDPRYSMESLRGRSSLSREVSFDFANAPSAAAPPSHNPTTAAPHVFSSAPGQRPVGPLLSAHQRGNNSSSSSSSSNTNSSPYPPRASGPTPLRTAPPIQPGGSHPSAAQRAYNEFPFDGPSSNEEAAASGGRGVLDKVKRWWKRVVGS